MIEDGAAESVVIFGVSETNEKKERNTGWMDVNGKWVFYGDEVEALDISDGCASTGYPFRVMITRDMTEGQLKTLFNRQKGKVIKHTVYKSEVINTWPPIFRDEENSVYIDYLNDLIKQRHEAEEGGY